MSITIKNLYQSILLKLKALYPEDEARAISDRMIEFFFGLRPVERVISGFEPVDEKKNKQVEEALVRLMAHEPLQYVIGQAWFMDMELEVNGSVLIPRPETEEMVGRIIGQYAEFKPQHPMQILDIGTGSGCIAIGLKKNIPQSEVTAIDVSGDALQVAIRNAIRNQVEISFLQADIFDRAQWDKMPKYDLIVSNPPYVTEAEKLSMQTNVLGFEPHNALFVPNEDPLVFYRAIASFAKEKLTTNGSLWLEINEQFGEDTKKLLIFEGFKDATIFSDFHKKERFLQATN